MQQRPLLSPAILLVESPQVNELTVPYSVSFTIPGHSHGLCYCSPTTPTKGSSRHSASGHQIVTGQTCLDCELGACSILRRLMKSRWEGLFRNIWHFFLTIAPEEVGSWLLKHSISSFVAQDNVCSREIWECGSVCRALA